MKPFIALVNVKLEEKIEKAPVTELKKMQNARLHWTLRHAFMNSPFYRRKFKENALTLSRIKNVQDLRKIPVTKKEDFRKNAKDFLAVSSEKVILSFETTGTTGPPCPVVFTFQDLDYSTRSVFRCMNIKSGDVVAQLYAFFAMVGHIRYLGALRLGAKVLPMGAANIRFTPRKIIETMKQYKPTVATGLTSDFLHLADAAFEMGIDPKTDIHIDRIQGGAELSTKFRRKKIEELWGAKFYDNYGFAELSIPFCECSEGGTHAWMDLYAIETVDPETGEVIQPGEQGEIAVTSLTRESMPLIRYCPGDIVVIHEDFCTCGRKHPILTVKGREVDKATINGLEFWYSDIENILMEHSEIGGEYQIEVRRKDGDDVVMCRAEVDRRLRTVDKRLLKESLMRDLSPLVKGSLEIEILQPDSLFLIWRTTGLKTQRILDLRSQ